MTEFDVIQKQEQSENKEFYLILIGSFLHAYEHGAFALWRVTGYKVISRHRKMGDVITAGFHVSQVDSVSRKITRAGGVMEKIDEKTWMFSGIDGTPDESVVCKPDKPVVYKSADEVREDAVRIFGKADVNADYSWLADAIEQFNLSVSTPLEAMMLIGGLQKQLKEFKNKQSIGLGDDKGI